MLYRVIRAIRVLKKSTKSLKHSLNLSIMNSEVVEENREDCLNYRS